jgi:hypothetical protein
MAMKKTIKMTHIQTGSPAKVCVVRFFLGCTLGSSDWQRQHTSLSSGFQVPQFGQFGMLRCLLLGWTRRHGSTEETPKQDIGRRGAFSRPLAGAAHGKKEEIGAQYSHVLLHPHLTRTTVCVCADPTATERTHAVLVRLLRTVSTSCEHRK